MCSNDEPFVGGLPPTKLYNFLERTGKETVEVGFHITFCSSSLMNCNSLDYGLAEILNRWNYEQDMSLSAWAKETELDILEHNQSCIYKPVWTELLRTLTSSHGPFTDHSMTLTQTEHLMWTRDLCLHVSVKFPPSLWPASALWCSL